MRPSLWRELRWKIRNLIRRLRGDYKPENSNMYKWAKSELDRLIVGCEDAEGKDGLEMQKLINKDILDVVKVFCGQGHSGSSASYALGKITRLLGWKPISPLTGEEGEWGEVYGPTGTQQNKRCFAVFREKHDNATAYYIDGKVFSDNEGHSWYTGRNSCVPVIFPFHVPEKPEYIYLNGEDSDEIITDPVRIQELYEAWGKKFAEV